MHRHYVIHAWKWLLFHLIAAATVGYMGTLLLASFHIAEPSEIMKTATAGLRHVGIPIMNQGMVLGVDQGVMIFLCNISVALLIVGVIAWVRLLNPQHEDRPFARFRAHLQRDRSAHLLRSIPPFSKIRSIPLRLVAFLLLGAPLIATVVMGLITGILFGTTQELSSSSLVAMAYLLPHGIPELSGLLLACSIPVGIWMAIRPAIEIESTTSTFRRIDRIVASQQFQSDLKMIINLLLIAGIVEAHFTPLIVDLLSQT